MGSLYYFLTLVAINFYTTIEFFRKLLDLRKILKLSVSGILALAVNKYLPSLMKENNSDNYHFQNYIIGKETIDGIICWRLVWGYTPKIIKFSPYPMH